MKTRTPSNVGNVGASERKRQQRYQDNQRLAKHAQERAEAEEAEARAILGELVCKVEGHSWQLPSQLCQHCGISWVDQFEATNWNTDNWDTTWSGNYTVSANTSNTFTMTANAVTALNNTYPATWTTYVET